MTVIEPNLEKENQGDGNTMEMMKRMLPLVLAAVLCVQSGAGVFAEEDIGQEAAAAAEENNGQDAVAVAAAEATELETIEENTIDSGLSLSVVEETEAVAEDEYEIIDSGTETVEEVADAGTAVASGECGENAIWTLTGEGDELTLSISGTGSMFIYSGDTLPWREYRRRIGEVIVGDEIDSLSGDSFSDMSGLKTVVFGNSIKSVPEGCFKNCTGLEEIELPDCITQIEDSAFYCCSGLQRIDIPDSVTRIGEFCFMGCDSLQSISLPDGLTCIEDFTFAICTSLQSIDIPESAERIGSGAFSNCKSLKKVKIPGKVTSIGASVFQSCSQLEEVILPGDLADIGYYAFSNCKSLRTLALPDGLKKIDDYAFYHCESLAAVTIPGSTIRNIGTSAFKSCPLKEVYFQGSEEEWQEVRDEFTILTDGRVHYVTSLKMIPTVCFKNDIVIAEYGEHIENPLVIRSDGEAAYSSASPETASVDSDGIVETRQYGETFIRVFVSETEEYYSGESSYKLIVSSKIEPSVVYNAKVVNRQSWQDEVRDGEQAGTVGRALIMEAFRIRLQDAANGEAIHTDVLGVEYSGHIQNVGWESWVSNGAAAGRPGKGLRIEALKLRLTGEWKDRYDIYYCLHCQNYGWLGWAKNGEESGTAGMSLRVEALCIKILPKGSAAPAKLGSYTQTYMYSPTIFYSSYVQGRGWQNEVRKGHLSGSSGESLRLEGVKIRVSGEKNLGVRYSGHVENKGWMPSVTNGAECGLPNTGRRIEGLALKLTGGDKDLYDIYYCLHVQNFGWLAWAKNGELAGSSGVSMRVEAYVIKILPKGSPRPKNYSSRKEAFVDGVGATKMTLSSTTAKVALNKTVTLTAAVLPANRTFKGVKWTSSNASVASVSSAGVVTGKKKGTAQVTCTSNDGRVSAVCTVTVT